MKRAKLQTTIALVVILLVAVAIAWFQRPPTSRVRSLAGQRLTDADLAELSSQTGLVSLDLSQNPDLIGDGLRHLRSLKQLRHLSLAGSSIGDTALHHLAALKSLESLDLSETQVAGHRFYQLAELKQLRSLTLRGCPLERMTT